MSSTSDLNVVFIGIYVNLLEESIKKHYILQRAIEKSTIYFQNLPYRHIYAHVLFI